MEIDPRLCPDGHVQSSEGPRDGKHYMPSPASVQDSRTNSATSEYPEPFREQQQLHTPTGSNNGYYAPPQSHPQPLYQTQPQIPLNPGNGPDPYDPKRPRACESCRGLKVRCESDPSNPGGPACKRCAKAGRNCVVTAPSRKRQKKTDSRVAELERKIDALTASLNRRVEEPASSGVREEVREEVPRRWIASGQRQGQGQSQNLNGQMQSPTLAGTKRGYSGEAKEQNNIRSPERDVPKQWRSWLEAAKPEPRNDIIDRGLVSAHVASKSFDRYVNDMAPQIPIVVFPPGTTMDDVRRTKPILLHAIAAIAIGPFQPDAQMILIDDFYKIIAERVVVKAEKSLELIQAILVTTTWYIPPESFEEIKFYHMTHMAVSIGMDIGMNQRAVASKPIKTMKEVLGKKPSSLDPDAPETRRAWLGCYILAVQAAISLRRVILVRWQPYMDECLEILEKSPAALPSDKVLIQWVKLVHITEEVGFQFSSEELGPGTSFSDPKIQYTLRVFEKQLDQWRRETPPEIYSWILKQTDYVLDLFMHESAMNVDPNTTPDSAAHMNALTTALKACHNALDLVLSIDIKTFICFPTANLARTSSVLVGLIKLYSLVSAPDSRIGQVIDPATLRVEWYMNRVLEFYRAAGEYPGGRTAAKFAVVINLFSNWFVKRKDHHVALREAFDGPRQGTICSQIREVDEARKTSGQTPLHLLSEVAMGEPNRPDSRHSFQQHQQPSDIQPMTSSTSTEDWPSPYPVPLLSAASHAHTRPSYQPPQPQPYDYQDYTATPSSAVPGSGGDPLMQGVFVPELGVQVGLDPDNLLALGNMLGDGFFNLGWPDGGGFY